MKKAIIYIFTGFLISLAVILIVISLRSYIVFIFLGILFLVLFYSIGRFVEIAYLNIKSEK